MLVHGWQASTPTSISTGKKVTLRTRATIQNILIIRHCYSQAWIAFYPFDCYRGSIHPSGHFPVKALWERGNMPPPALNWCTYVVRRRVGTSN